MRWLANENMPLASIRRLRVAEHDVAAVIEDAPSSEDAEVLARAVREDRIILTFDRDYGELIYRLRLPSPPGLVYFRFIPSKPEEPSDRLLHLLAKVEVSLEGYFTIVERGQVHQRALP